MLTMQSPSLKHYIKLEKLVLLFLRRLFREWIIITAKQPCLYNSKGLAYTRTGSFKIL